MCRSNPGDACGRPIPHGSSKMSHVIPRRVFQTLKSCRWDCNVCGVSRKMTKLNYVRLWGCEVGVWCLSAWALRRLPLGPFGTFRSGCAWRRPIPHGSSKMSHVIPRRVFQTLKSCRWDCNVCGVSRKMTKLNYVRLWGCEVGVWCLSAWALRRLPLGPFGTFRSGCAWRRPIPHGSSKMSHVIPRRVFQTLKSCRWDCNVCGVS